MTMLDRVTTPAHLRALPSSELPALASEIRDFLIEHVARTGGHLGPNLGVVELTLAIHRVFDSPRDPIVWDTGHQSYVHKLLTGRAAEFTRLRKEAGLSGYPSRRESSHDIVENSHASTALSWADGLSRGIARRGEANRRRVVAVIGDGALTGGMAWEALNNIAGSGQPVVMIVNDNGRSYSPTIGGLSRHLADLRTSPQYERVLQWGKDVLHRTPVVGPSVYDALHGVKRGLRDVLVPQGMFEGLGLKYLGPIDGHDVELLEHILHDARRFEGPVIVHAITEKGRGYPAALDDEAERFHSVPAINPTTGAPITVGGPTWTSTFSSALIELGGRHPELVAITAAMPGPTGLDAFAARFPDRFIDVGIAEQHAVTAAAGMAYTGLHPVVAVYATFLSRAFDQVLMDCALHRAAVTFVLDRAGVTGDDGASHNGMWDLSILQVVPGLRIAAPRDGERLRELLGEAVAVSDGPTVVRFPKGALGEPVPALAQRIGLDILVDPPGADVLLVSVGPFASMACEVAHRCADHGVGVRVVDPRWVTPVPQALVDLIADHRLVVVVEDNVRHGGVAAAVSQACRDAGVDVPQRDLGLPAAFLDHGSRAEVLARVGLTSQQVSRTIIETIAALTTAAAPVPPADDDPAGQAGVGQAGTLATPGGRNLDPLTRTEAPLRSR